MWLHKLSIPEYIKVTMLDTAGSYQKLYMMKAAEYEQFELSKDQIIKIEESKKYIDEFLTMFTQYTNQDIYIIDIKDEHYPYYLKQIPDPPIVLFVKGDLSYLNKPAIAVVGSRKCTEYGYDVTYRLAAELAKTGIVIVSGMAYGIDEAAHKGALKTGSTIAVMGTGINLCYPNRNRDIYSLIPQQGCLISEYFLDTPPLPFRFPKRNRIISGMALGILVTEADVKSGSLITADLALEYNRDIFAVPGNITSKLSLGTNELIKKGAKCITTAEDILEELSDAVKAQIDPFGISSLENNNYKLAQEESMVYAYVSWEPISLNELFRMAMLPYEIVYPSLIKLEIKGFIKRLPGERYVRV